MFFIREIQYLSYYEQSKKMCNAGTAKCQIRDRELVIQLHLNRLPDAYQKEAAVVVVLDKTGIHFEEKIFLYDNQMDYRFQYELGMDLYEKPIIYFTIVLGNGRVICDEKTMLESLTREAVGYGTNIETEIQPEIQPKEIQSEEVQREEIQSEEVQREEIQVSETGQEDDKIPTSKVKVVHIKDKNGEDEFFVVEPKHLEQMGEEWASYANNSFLLHGYYNYRHILVGPTNWKETGVCKIGVPGNYFQREEAVAAMFGFTFFVSQQEEKMNGAFGYYIAEWAQ